MSFDSEDLTYPPFGGRAKLILLGILLPGFIFWLSARAWMNEEAFWPGRGGRGQGIVVKGEAALAMAAVYFSAALFIHSRWFWGLLQMVRVFTAGTVISCVLFLGGVLWALCCV